MPTGAQWQSECGQGLIDAVNLGGEAGRAHWSGLRQQWLTQGRERVTLADLDLTQRDLRGYDLTRCWIGRTRFIRANLSGADFSQSIFRGCDFEGANLSRTSFFDADLSDDPSAAPNRMTDVRFDRATDMEVRQHRLAAATDQSLVDFANTAWRRTEWLNRRSKSRVYRILARATDYGFGVGRLSWVAAVVVLAFSGPFYLLDDDATPIGSLLDSARYFLGLGDPFEGSNALLSLVGMIETGLGLVALALLIAIFTNKFTDL